MRDQQRHGFHFLFSRKHQCAKQLLCLSGYVSLCVWPSNTLLETRKSQATSCSESLIWNWREFVQKQWPDQGNEKIGGRLELSWFGSTGGHGVSDGWRQFGVSSHLADHWRRRKHAACELCNNLHLNHQMGQGDRCCQEGQTNGLLLLENLGTGAFKGSNNGVGMVAASIANATTVWQLTLDLLASHNHSHPSMQVSPNDFLPNQNPDHLCRGTILLKNAMLNINFPVKWL